MSAHHYIIQLYPTQHHQQALFTGRSHKALYAVMQGIKQYTQMTISALKLQEGHSENRDSQLETNKTWCTFHGTSKSSWLRLNIARLQSSSLCCLEPQTPLNTTDQTHSSATSNEQYAIISISKIKEQKENCNFKFFCGLIRHSQSTKLHEQTTWPGVVQKYKHRQ